MSARAAEDQQAACESLSGTARGQLQDLATAVPNVERGDSCVSILTTIDEQTQPSARVNTMKGPIGSLRLEGNRDSALYHGTKDTDHTIQMKREGGAWKVGALASYPLG